MAASPLREIPLDDDHWDWGGAEFVQGEHLGRSAVSFREGFAVAAARGVELGDGMIELDLAIGGERSFHGVAWHLADGANYESFFLRPHQSGNPDAVQYTPVWNSSSAWQLYHGEGYWAPLAFPIGEWFTIRLAFARGRAEVFVGDGGVPAVAIGELKLGRSSGRIGILVGGPGLHVARFAHDSQVTLVSSPPAPPASPKGVITRWEVSDPFAEAVLAEALGLDPVFVAERRWTTLEAEPSGLVNLARATGIQDGRNTVLARAAIASERIETRRLAFGFSDRVTVYLNGRALYRGDDSYRSRDYRFLGSVGF